VLAAGIDLHVKQGARVEQSEPLFTIHAEARGELACALDYVHNSEAPVRIEESP
jgi:thymidine phosphorylase